MSFLWTWASHRCFTKAISGAVFGHSVFDLQRRWGQLSGRSLRSLVIELEGFFFSPWILGNAVGVFPTLSVQFSLSVMSNSLWPHGLQHSRPPCPSPTPRVYSNSYPLSQWCHPTSSSSVAPFSSRLQSFPASGSFPISQLFASGGQSIEVSASASVLVLPVNTQDWSPLGWTGWVSLQAKGLSSISSDTTVQKHQFFSAQPSL